MSEGEREVRVLDHGYVRLVGSWGSDEEIVRSARMSTQKGFLGWGPKCPHADLRDENGELDGHEHVLRSAPFHPDPKAAKCSRCGTVEAKAGDEKLLRYLWENDHATPFEFAGLTVEVRAPIVVFREWHRHRTQSYTEASARYAPLPALDYVPTLERMMRAGGHLTKQAAAHGEAVLTEENAEEFRRRLAAWQGQGEELYRWGLDVGVSKELARGAMTVFRYSTMRASGNLRNWLGFERLRLSPKAQEEIRAYAQAVGEMLADRFPRTWELFAEGRG